jgi:hypothetical protein
MLSQTSLFSGFKQLRAIFDEAMVAVRTPHVQWSDGTDSALTWMLSEMRLLSGSYK